MTYESVTTSRRVRQPVWSAFQQDGPTSDGGEAIVFHVSAETSPSFPELEGAEVVALRVTNRDVHETRLEDAAAHG